MIRKSWLLAAFLAGYTFNSLARAADPYAGLDLYARVLAIIQANYVEPVSQLSLIHASLQGMTHSLDPHSEFYPPETWKSLEAQGEGTYVGAGLEGRWEKDAFVIRTLVRGGPADTGGLQPNDRILSINQHPLNREAEALSLLEAPEGSLLDLGLERAGQSFHQTLLLIRPSMTGVEGKMLEGQVGYVAIHIFRNGTAEAFRKQLSSLEGMKKLVIDLRGNGGGLLEEGVSVADQVLEEGRIVRVLPRTVAPEEFLAHAEEGDWKGPLRVLVDRNSASASEVVAGALQVLKRARVVGEPTYGKGTVQRYYEFEDGSVLRLTFARYFLPDQSSVQGRGVVPEVLASPRNNSEDPPLAAALKDLAGQP